MEKLELFCSRNTPSTTPDPDGSGGGASPPSRPHFVEAARNSVGVPYSRVIWARTHQRTRFGMGKTAEERSWSLPRNAGPDLQAGSRGGGGPVEPGASGTSGETSSAAAALGNGGFGEGVEREGREREGTARERGRGVRPTKTNRPKRESRILCAEATSGAARGRFGAFSAVRSSIWTARIICYNTGHWPGRYLSFLPTLIYGYANECRELNYFFSQFNCVKNTHYLMHWYFCLQLWQSSSRIKKSNSILLF